MKSFLLSVAFVLLSAALPTHAGSTTTPRSVTVVHRHGARTPIVWVNGRTSCQFPYCQLTEVGMAQSRAVGRHIREKYFNLGGGNQVEGGWGLLKDQEYNVSFIHSESTQIPRVTISGEAAVMGMWPGSLPFVDFEQTETDIRMSMWTSWPAWKIANTYSVTASNYSLDLLTEMIGTPVLDRLAAVYPFANCRTNGSRLLECIALAQDELASNTSASLELDPFLGLEGNWNKLRSVVAMFTSDMLSYNPEVEYDRLTGSLGLPMAQHILGQIKYESKLTRVHHYACHDLTLMALYGAIGHWIPANRTNPKFVPRFAETLIFEEYRAITEKGADQPVLAAYWGYPDQAPPKGGQEADYNLDNLEPATLRCIPDGPDAVPYVAHSCPLEDLERYVNSTSPESPSGICYATEASLAMNDCMGTGPVEPGSRCYFYREYCPAEPCAKIEGSIADIRSNFSCVVPPVSSHYMGTTLVALIVPPLVLGSVLGFYLLPKVFGIGSSVSTSPLSDEEASLTEK